MEEETEETGEGKQETKEKGGMEDGRWKKRQERKKQQKMK
jgi:hypothetical protein